MIAAEVVAEIVARSRARQGLPEKVTDPAVLHQIAAVLHQRDEARATTPGHSLNTVLPLAKEAERHDGTP